MHTYTVAIKTLVATILRNISVQLKCSDDVNTERFHYKVISDKNVKGLFLSLKITSHTHLVLMVTNCSGG